MSKRSVFYLHVHSISHFRNGYPNTFCFTKKDKHLALMVRYLSFFTLAYVVSMKMRLFQARAFITTGSVLEATNNLRPFCNNMERLFGVTVAKSL